MDGLHNLVTQGKVLYLVSVFAFLSLPSPGADRVLHRVLRMYLPGSFLRLIDMPGIMERAHSSFIRALGTFSLEISRKI